MKPITHIRKKVFGMSQAQFAEALGVSQSTVSRWDSGTAVPTQTEMEAIRELASKRSIEWNDSWFFETAP